MVARETIRCRARADILTSPRRTYTSTTSKRDMHRLEQLPPKMRKETSCEFHPDNASIARWICSATAREHEGYVTRILTALPPRGRNKISRSFENSTMSNNNEARGTSTEMKRKQERREHLSVSQEASSKDASPRTLFSRSRLLANLLGELQ